MTTKTLVDRALKDAQEEEVLAAKAIEVVKVVPLDYDLGHLMATDNNPIDTKLFKQDVNTFLHNLARDDAQLIINEVFNLPSEMENGFRIAKLPKPKTVLPRAQRVPLPRQPTKWQRFAAKKGIQSSRNTREKTVFDETAQEWKPRYGYKSKANQDSAAGDWMMELKDGQDANENVWKAKREAKKEKVAKNEVQRLKNIARAASVSTSGAGKVGVTTNSNKKKSSFKKGKGKK